MEKLIPAILEGKAKSAKIAEKISLSYKDCPYIAFMASDENHVYIAYFLPEKQKWRAEYVKRNPQKTLGLENIRLIFPQRLYSPKKMKMQLPRKKTEIAPCNSDCSKCPSYVKCTGCPATIYYKEK